MNVTSIRVAKNHGNIHLDLKWDEKTQYLSIKQWRWT